MGKKKAVSEAPKELKEPKHSVQTFPTLEIIGGYLSPLANELESRYGLVKLIAEGRTGAAYELRSVDNPHLLVCLKTIRQLVIDYRGPELAPWSWGL